jgi:hypothetical protein
MMYTNKLMETISTYDGTTALRKDCRFIKGAFYEKNRQCFYIENIWYRVNSGKIVFDHELKIWVIKDSVRDLVHGVTDIRDDMEPEFGYFTPNKYKNTFLVQPSGIVYTVLDENILRDNVLYFTEGFNGVYFPNSMTVGRAYTSKLKPKKEGFYSFPFNYGSDELIPEFSEICNKLFKGYPLSSNAYKHLDGFTFGVEFETCVGAIPERFLAPNGLIACRDGSITGFEYATIPLSGEKGIQIIKQACYLLQKYCQCSANESLHIHIGGFPKTVKAIASLYRLALLLEDEIYSLFPVAYIDTAQFKRKSYCGPLYKIDSNLTTPIDILSGLYYFLSNGGKFSKFPTAPHPLDRSGQHKWEVSPRYVWINMIPLIWGGRGTVEFRCHVPTVNAQKVINWLFIIVAILKYAQKHGNILISHPMHELSKVTLSKIIQEVYPEPIGSILIEYINDRKSHYYRGNDPTGDCEITNEIKGKNPMFQLKSFV